MSLNKFMSVVDFAAKQHSLDIIDLMVLNDIAVNGKGTIMKILDRPILFANATRHEHIKKLCKRGLLDKSEMDGDMRFKVILLSEKGAAILKELEERLA